MPQAPPIRLFATSLTAKSLTAKSLAAIVLVQAFALFARELLRRQLQQSGIAADYAADLSYLVVPPVLIVMLFPVLSGHLPFLRSLFNRRHLTLRLVVTAIAVGVLMRIVWWSQLVSRIAFGFTQNTDANDAPGAVFSFGCPPAHVIGLGFLVMAMLVPILEEIINRGLIQSAFAHRGRCLAVAVSALLFSVFHPPSDFAFVFLFGVILGLLFWNSGTLWGTLIAHASYNGLIQLDWRCIRGTWNPAPDQVPLVATGSIALVALSVSLLATAWLVSTKNAGVRAAPRPLRSERVGNSLNDV